MSTATILPAFVQKKFNDLKEDIEKIVKKKTEKVV